MRKKDWRRLLALPKMQNLPVPALHTTANGYSEDFSTKMSHVQRKPEVSTLKNAKAAKSDIHTNLKFTRT
jgi:hypothetical protein